MQEQLKLQIKNKWTPSDNHHTVKTFIDLVQNDINDAKSERKIKLTPNLTKSEKESMKKIQREMT